MKKIIFLAFLTISLQIIAQSNDSIFIAKRNLALADWDFKLADYYYGEIQKETKDSLNLKRKWVSNINFQPKISSVSDFDIAGPFLGFDWGFGLNPTAKWQTQHQMNDNGISLESINGKQSNYKFENSYRLNEKWELKLNFHSMNIRASQTDFNELLQLSSDSIEIPFTWVDSSQTQSGQIQRGVYSTSIGFINHNSTTKIGGFLGIRNQYLNDSLTVYKTDSTPEIRSFNSLSVGYHQLSFFGEWLPKKFNSGLRLTGWVDLPFSGKEISFSPYLKTEIRLTPNTWIGGWVRTYTSSLEPVELGATTQNFGLEEVYLKYGGTINYQKTRRWWVEFNIELQKRKAYKSNLKYSTLSLDFKFTYRLLQRT